MAHSSELKAGSSHEVRYPAFAAQSTVEVHNRSYHPEKSMH